METIKGTLDGTQPEQPTMYMIDATKCKSIEEMGQLFNALGIAVSMEYAKENNMEHLLVQS